MYQVYRGWVVMCMLVSSEIQIWIWPTPPHTVLKLCFFVTTSSGKRVW